jgi:aryl-phospho-beta-D-glucosidase BglC (GH1 family)
MNAHQMNRREFLRAAGIGAAVAVTGHAAESAKKPKPAQTAIPRWRGFNLLDYFSPQPTRPNRRNRTTEDDLRWMSDWGFDFVRIPMAYPQWIDFDPAQRITPDDMYKIKESALEYIDGLVEMAHQHNLHVSLNFHRAPGYCVNAGFHEPFNLWKDQEALDAFCFHWGMWAERLSLIHI